MLWRHGDVLIETISAIPTGGQRRLSPVLVYGEATGHSHRIETAEAAEIWEVSGQLYLKVTDPTQLIHEEHQPIALAPGLYRVWQQREYAPPTIRTTRFTSFDPYRTIRD
jgi:hypothetical protein